MCPSENYRFDPNNIIVLLSFPSALQSGVGGCNSVTYDSERRSRERQASNSTTLIRLACQYTLESVPTKI